VVRDRHGDRSARQPQPFDIDASPAQTWDVSAVSSEDVATVRAFLERRSDLGLQHRNQIAAELASRLRGRVGGAPPDIGDERFLELLAAVKGARS
jgi:hypothetical protein